jgi:hypothetical protein
MIIKNTLSAISFVEQNWVHIKVNAVMQWWFMGIRETGNYCHSFSMALQLKSGLGLLIWSFVILLFRHLVGLLWTSYQPVAKASTYKGQHNTETQRQTSMPRSRFEPTIPAIKRSRHTT